jgi:putative Holliday junction resolvase
MNRILGIDHGLKRIGIAIGDEITGIATPYTTLVIKKKMEEIILKINEICKTENIEKIIIGLPRQPDQRKEVIKFVELLKKIVEVPIIFEDEEFTTMMAEKLDRHSDDAVAASIILQTYFDKLREKGI